MRWEELFYCYSPLNHYWCCCCEHFLSLWANFVIDHCGFCYSFIHRHDETTYPFPVDTKRINELVHSRKLVRTFRQGRYGCDVDDNSASSSDCCGREPHNDLSQSTVNSDCELKVRKGADVQVSSYSSSILSRIGLSTMGVANNQTSMDGILSQSTEGAPFIEKWFYRVLLQWKFQHRGCASKHHSRSLHFLWEFILWLVNKVTCLCSGDVDCRCEWEDIIGKYKYYERSSHQLLMTKRVTWEVLAFLLTPAHIEKDAYLCLFASLWSK